MNQWSGVFPAVTTKLERSGEINLTATQASIERLVDNKVSGIIVLPMLGENASLNLDEKLLVLRAAKEVVAGRVPLLSGLAEVTSQNAVHTARTLQDAGAEGLMMFPSLCYRTDPRETAEWYANVARQCDLPIMIYNNPLAFGVDVDCETLQRLADVPSIVAVKEETGDSRRISDIYNELGNRFSVFCGIDDLILESTVLGATGWVSGMTNAWPRECVLIYSLCLQGRFTEARELNRIMTPAFHLDTRVKLVQYIKFAEHLVYGAPEWTRPPRLPLIGSERAAAERIVRQTIAGLENLRYPTLAA